MACRPDFDANLDVVLSSRTAAKATFAVYDAPNTRRFLLHQDFLADVFPERFPGLTTEEYASLVGRRASRDYFVGAITRLRTHPVRTYGFSVFADFADPGEALSAEDEDCFSLTVLVAVADEEIS